MEWNDNFTRTRDSITEAEENTTEEQDEDTTNTKAR